MYTEYIHLPIVDKNYYLNLQFINERSNEMYGLMFSVILFMVVIDFKKDLI